MARFKKEQVFSVDIRICATAYIKARSAAEALRIARGLKHDGLELRRDEDGDCGIPISGRSFGDPDLPDLSLSPAMTIHGAWGKHVEHHEEAGADEEDGDEDHDHDGEDEPGPTNDDLYDTSGEAHRPQINDAGERMY